MKIASTLSVALLAGLSIAMWTSYASAQQPAGWAAAAAKCRAQARAQYPKTSLSPEVLRSNRAHLYRACLFSAGYRP
jgi:hypothetical protein